MVVVAVGATIPGRAQAGAGTPHPHPPHPPQPGPHPPHPHPGPPPPHPRPKPPHPRPKPQPPKPHPQPPRNTIVSFSLLNFRETTRRKIWSVLQSRQYRSILDVFFYQTDLTARL